MGALSRLTPFFIAVIFPLFAFAWFVPKGVVQIDLWFLWLLAMLMAGLPILFAEFALAKRSGAPPFAGMQILTRQSDASIIWRSFAGLSILLAILICAQLIAILSAGIQSFNLGLASQAVSGALMFGALILSLLKKRLLPIAVILTLIGVLLTLVDASHLRIQMTQSGFAEWGMAVVMALVSVGAGTGLYWFSCQEDHLKHLTRPVFLVWLAQLSFGLLGFVVVSMSLSLPALFSYGIGALILAGFLLHYAMNQLMGRFGIITGAIATLLLALIFALIPSTILTYLIASIGLLTGLVLAVFTGWQMKISHLRKSLNFSRESFYNLWRVAIRIITPLVIITGLIGFFWR